MAADLSAFIPPALFSSLDRHFAAFILRIAQSDDVDLALAAALTSRATEQGHTCVDLAGIAGGTLGDPESGEALLKLPPMPAWRAILEGSPVVGEEDDFRPLILDAAGRLYLHRYWQAEADLAADLLQRVSSQPLLPPIPGVREHIGRLFGPQPPGAPCDWQRVAVLAALRSRLCVISGGPGTGKTTTVVRLLALLLESSEAGMPRIALCAPTGKAASRLAESIRSSKAGLNCPEAVRDKIPEEVSTIHRLLQPDRTGEFRRGPDNPLPVDLVVVDEASMIDLSLMHSLVQALPETARLVLLGDRDQLASVEAGAVLGDICGRGDSAHGAAFSAFVQQVTGRPLPDSSAETASPLADAVIVLRHTYRFGAESGIGRLAAALNGGDADGALALLNDPGVEDVRWMHVDSGGEGLDAVLRRRVVEFWRSGFSGTPQGILDNLSSFRILCALRRGPYGVETINRRIEQILEHAGLIRPHGQHYAGRPIMVTRNDYRFGLFNGDTGILLSDPESAGALRAFFPGEGGSLRRISPSRLPDHETVFAMTVHKSQGSEFDHVLLLLPDVASELLTRELLYTAVTRARREVEIYGRPEVLKVAVQRRIERTSGLHDRLWGTSSEMTEE